MDRKLRRKGMTMESALVTIVIFGAAMIVLIVIYNMLFSVGKSQFSEKECQSSLMLTRALDAHQPACFAKFPNPIPLKCNRDFLSVDDVAVVKNGKDVTASYRRDCPAGAASCLPETVLAEEMRACWHRLFEGDVVVFQQVDKNFGSFFSINNGKNYLRACFVCSEVSLRSSQAVKLEEYLKAQPMSGKDGRTYYAYLTDTPWCDKYMFSEKAQTCWDAMNQPIADHWYRGGIPALGTFVEGARPDTTVANVRTGQTYAVTFVRRGLGSCAEDKDANSKSGSYMRDGEGGFLTMSVQLVPTDQISKECDLVIV